MITILFQLPVLHIVCLFILVLFSLIPSISFFTSASPAVVVVVWNGFIRTGSIPRRPPFLHTISFE